LAGIFVLVRLHWYVRIVQALHIGQTVDMYMRVLTTSTAILALRSICNTREKYFI